MVNHIERLADYLIVTIGSINLERVLTVLAAGVGSIAVVSIITQMTDRQIAVVQLLNIAGMGGE